MLTYSILLSIVVVIFEPKHYSELPNLLSIRNIRFLEINKHFFRFSLVMEVGVEVYNYIDRFHEASPLKIDFVRQTLLNIHIKSYD